MTFKKIRELEDILVKIRKTNFLMCCIIERYFKDARPVEMEFIADYRIYSDLLDMVRCTVIEQEEALRKAINEIYESGELL